MIIFLISKAIFKDWINSGLVASIIILSFASYGQVYSALEVSAVFAGTLGRHRFLAPLWLVITAVLVWWAVRRAPKSTTINSVMNVFSAALLILPLLNLANYAWLNYRNAGLNKASVDKISNAAGASSKVKPDVYYIILDMYARDDILLERFNYDNSAFLQQLEEMGFYVAKCSVTNYNMTELSLASSFNMNYLDQLGDQYRAGKPTARGWCRSSTTVRCARFLRGWATGSSTTRPALPSPKCATRICSCSRRHLITRMGLRPSA